MILNDYMPQQRTRKYYCRSCKTYQFRPSQYPFRGRFFFIHSYCENAGKTVRMWRRFW